MHYKGKVVDSAVAPLTSTGKTVETSTQCDYTEDDTTRDLFNKFTAESTSKSKNSSY